ncbi:MAG: hypothetical protein QOC99_2746 [Acidobacteriota bacterium]|jgi:hypothetical protein|nr:hypothetical protein [Acidobacteriota bacterium]MDT7780234.1 hypothetical protein [Acidobacteriota bacterium]
MSSLCSLLIVGYLECKDFSIETMTELKAEG